MSKTPMLKQYEEIHAQYPDCLLFFRLGDFYELFGEDAKVAAKLLEITLTSREAGGGQRIPMCGVPAFAADQYIARLVKAGKRVAICEQVEDPKLAKGVVKRKVVRVVTPGTVSDPGFLDAKANNFLAAIHQEGDRWGLASLDLSTGEFMATEFTGPDSSSSLKGELARLAPSECLLEKGRSLPKELIQPEKVRELGPECFSLERAKKILKEHFGAIPAGTERKPLFLQCAGAILLYLQQTQNPLSGILELRTYWSGTYLGIDPASRRNLELVANLRDGGRGGTLLGVLDRTVTAMGGRMLRRWLEQPLLDLEKIQARLDAVEELAKEGLLRGELQETLAKLYDLERLLGKAFSGSANARDLLAMGSSLGLLRDLLSSLAETQSVRMVQIREELGESAEVLLALGELLLSAICDDPPTTVREGNIIRDGYNQEVDRLRSLSSSGKDWIAKLEAQERERTGIKSLKVGFNKVFGYYLEVTKTNLKLVPEEYQRRQTLANAERFITPQLKEFEEQVLGAQERLVELEYDLFVELRQKVLAEASHIQSAARIVAQLDCLCSLAQIAVEHNYKRPEVTESGALSLTGARHPIVEEALPPGTFVPNDLYLDAEKRMIILTGPNMAGKSTYGKTVLLCQIMAQMGSFLPAEAATVPIADRVFVRAGSSEDMSTGKSTFMMELLETAEILSSATSKSLIFVDELGRGTSTYDGMAISQAVMEYLHDKIKARAIISTHYHQPTEREGKLAGAVNYHVSAVERDGELTFLYTVRRGGTDKSYGINVARMAGIPRSVISRARQILRELEATHNGQLSLPLFGQGEAAAAREETVEEKLCAEILALDPNKLSPLEALNLIYSWQRRLEEEA